MFIQGFSGVDTEIARGVAIYNDLYPIISINNDDRYPAKTFSIIHELVHIFKRQSTMCNDMVTSFSAQQEEVFCNAVAGEDKNAVIGSASVRLALFNIYLN